MVHNHKKNGMVKRSYHASKFDEIVMSRQLFDGTYVSTKAHQASNVQS